MSHRVAVTVLATVTVVGLVGCGGSNKGKLTFLTEQTISASECPSSGCGASLHSPNHHYTAKQVKAAFASQGFHLHKLRKALVPGALVLSGGPFPRLVVYVSTIEPAFSNPRNYPHPECTRHANVLACSADTAQVKSALAKLH